MNTKNPRADKREPEWTVTDEQVEDALKRLLMTVQDEAVPEVWQARPNNTKEETNMEIKRNETHFGGAKINDAGTAATTKGMAEESTMETGSDPRSQLTAPGAEYAESAAFAAPRSSKRRSSLRRRWMSGAAAAALAGVMFFTSWGQDVMANMLSTFRVQHFETISVTQSDLSDFRQALEDGTIGTRQLDLRLYGEIRQSGSGTVRTVGSAEAEKLAGGHLKLLPGADAEATDYMPQQEIEFKLHPKEINKLIALMGGKTEFPASVDNAPIKLVMPNSFTMRAEGKDGSQSKRLVQLPAPTLNVPDDVDVEQVRQAVLDLPVLPDDLRTKLAAIGDWRHTVPVPSIEGENIRTIAIDGNEAIVSTENNSRTIIWLQNDWMYMLSGSLDAYPTENDMIKEAKGLMNA